MTTRLWLGHRTRQNWYSRYCVWKKIFTEISGGDNNYYCKDFLKKKKNPLVFTRRRFIVLLIT